MQRNGARIRGRYLTLFVLSNELDVTRLGVVATRRLGGAVIRNRSKRLVREIYRLNKAKTSALGLDIVVMPRPGFSEAPFDTLEADYLSAVKRHGRTRTQ